jgi:hypothetical protein
MKLTGDFFVYSLNSFGMLIGRPFRALMRYETTRFQDV